MEDVGADKNGDLSSGVRRFSADDAKSISDFLNGYTAPAPDPCQQDPSGCEHQEEPR